MTVLDSSRWSRCWGFPLYHLKKASFASFPKLSKYWKSRIKIRDFQCDYNQLGVFVFKLLISITKSRSTKFYQSWSSSKELEWSSRDPDPSGKFGCVKYKICIQFLRWINAIKKQFKLIVGKPMKDNRPFFLGKVLFGIRSIVLHNRFHVPIWSHSRNFVGQWLFVE